MEFIDLKSQYQASRDGINRRIQAVLDHGQYIMGPEVAELEERLAAYTGARHCVTVASGTEALLIALMALYLHLGPFSRHVIREIELRIERLDNGPSVVPSYVREAPALAV